jgi:hypothetical protein
MNKVPQDASKSSSGLGQKRCFVISPIGDPGSEVREHADDVLAEIIVPAAEEAGYHVPGRTTRPVLAKSPRKCSIGSSMMI